MSDPSTHRQRSMRWKVSLGRASAIAAIMALLATAGSTPAGAESSRAANDLVAEIGLRGLANDFAFPLLIVGSAALATVIGLATASSRRRRGLNSAQRNTTTGWPVPDPLVGTTATGDGAAVVVASPADPTVAANPLPPPGWYSDPNLPGKKRWWDGERWTDYLATSERAPR